MNKSRLLLLSVFLLVFSTFKVFSATYTVTSTVNPWSGPFPAGSLAWAINQANSNPGPHTIAFNVTGPIVVGNPAQLPITQNDVTIDGTTNPGYTPGNPNVTINLPGYGTFDLSGTNTVVKDLIFTNGATSAIKLTGAGSVIENCIITGGKYTLGVNTFLMNNTVTTGEIVSIGNNVLMEGNDWDGVTTASVLVSGNDFVLKNNKIVGLEFLVSGNDFIATGNTFGINSGGVAVSSGKNTIFKITTGNNLKFGGSNPSDANYFAGTATVAVELSGGTNVSFEGNYFGTDKTGENQLGLDFEDVVRVRGATGTGNEFINNVIVGAEDEPGGSGLDIKNSSNFTIKGNYIGVTRNLNDIGNRWAGVFFDGGSNHIFDGNIVGANGRTGTNYSISHGIGVANATGITITNNYVGVAPDGSDIGNGDSGIELNAGSGAVVTGNYVGFNKGARPDGTAGGDQGAGISIINHSSPTIKNNYIGVSPNGSAAGNIQNGMTIEGNSSNFVIEDNVIANNGEAGIDFAKGTPSNIKITQNSIYCNGLEGIELNGRNGAFSPLPTVNSIGGNPGDSDTSGDPWVFKGSCPSGAVVEVFEMGPCNDCATGYGQGKKYLGLATVTGTTWEYSTPASSIGYGLVVTATVGGNRTSEFSDCVDLPPPPCSDPGTVTLSEIGDVNICGTTPSHNITISVTGTDTYQYLLYKDNVVVGSVQASNSFTLTDLGEYYVVASDPADAVLCNANSNTIKLIDTTPTTPILAGTQAYCAGESLSINVTPGTATTGAVYAWKQGATALTGTTATYTKTAGTPDAGSYTVTATKDGCSSAESASYALTVNEVPAKPTITANPTATSICTGDAVTLTSASVTTGVTYVWTKGTASGTNDKDIVIASAVTGDGGTYTTTATKTENGKACISPASDDFVLTVNTTPTTPVLAGTQAYCAGDNISLNVTAGTVTTGATYAWEKDAAAIAGTTATYTKASSVTTDAGSYTVTATNAGCSSAESAGYAVTVDEAVTITAITPAAVCSPGTVDITTGAVTPGTATVTYHVGAGGTGATQPTATAVATTGTYSVKAVNGQCNATSDVNVTVTSLPSAPTVTALSYCKDATGAAVLTATGSGLKWYDVATNGTALATAPTPSTAIVTTLDYYVSQTVTSCEGPRANLQVTINALPTVSATSDDADNKICLGDNVTLNGAGADSYTWDNGVTNNTAFSPTATVNYTVTGTNTATTCTNTASVQVEVNALPTVTTTVTGSPACLGANVTLAGGGASTYTWDNGVANGIAFATTTVGPTTYTVTGTDANNCTNTATGIVTVNALPTATLTGTATVCSGASTNLSIALTGAQPWEVVYNDPTAGNVTINPTSSPATASVSNVGAYTLVSVQDANNCIATSATGTATVSNHVAVAATTATVCSGSEVGGLTLGGTDFQIVVTATTGDLSTISIAETTAFGVVFTETAPGSGVWYSGAIAEANAVDLTITDGNNCNTVSSTGITTQCSCLATGSTTIGIGSAVTATICDDAGVTSSVTVVYSGGTGNHKITLIPQAPLTGVPVILDNQTTGIANFTVSEAGDYKVTVRSIGSACEVDGGSVTLAHHTTPVAQLTATSATTVCAGDNVTLEVKLTAGDAPFTFNLDNTTPVSSVAKTGATTTFTEAISTTGDYSITNVKDNNGCIGTASGAVTIANHANTAATAITKCDTPLGGVTLAADEFQIVVTATAGTFTSDPITETTAHGVTFSRVGLTDVWYSGAINEANAVDLDFADDNGCNTVDLDGLQKRCSCPAEIDDFTIDKTEICASPSQTATLTVTYSGGDATDTYTLSLTGAETQSNAGAAGSTSTTFTVSTPGTYNVAITNITQGNCVINGTTQKVLAHYTTPKAEITGDASICDDAPTVTTPLTITLTDGVAPFTLDVSNGVGAITGATTAHTENVSASGSYTLSNLVDNNGCEGTVSGSATITHLAKVAATPTTRCDDESPLGSISLTDSEYQIVVTATAGDMASLVITGATFQETAAGSGIWYSGAIAEAVTSAVHVTDANDCEGGIDLTGITRTCSCQAKGVTTLTTGTICAEGSTTIEVVTSNAAGNYNVTLTQPDATTQTTSNKPAGTETFTVNQAGNYTVLVRDVTENCDVGGGTATLAHYPIPTATLAGDASICDNGVISASTDLTITLTAGTGPFAIDVLGGTATANLTNLTSGDTETVTTAGNYTLTNLVDANNCQGTVSGTAVVSYYDEVVAAASAVCNKTPLSVLGGVTLTGTQFQVVVTVTQGDLSSVVVTKIVGGVALTRDGATNKWYSGAIDETTSVDVHVTDGNNCNGGTDITGLQTQCSCPIKATATLLPASICADGTSSAVLNVAVTSTNTTGMTDYTINITDTETQNATETPNASGEVSKDFTVNTNGSYTINVTSNGQNGGCTVSAANQNLTVNELPTASITTTALAYCAGETPVDLVATTVVGATSYEWFKGGVTQGTTATPTKTGADAGDWTVKVSDGNGCNQTSAAVTVVENTLPIAAITTSGTDLEYCKDGAGVILSATNVANATTYAWLKGAITETTGPGNTKTGALAGSWTVKVIDDNTCTATSTAVSVIENPLPTPSITTSGTALEYCKNATGVTLSATGGVDYAWIKDNGTATAYSTTATTSDAKFGNWQVKVKDAKGCEATSSVVAVKENTLPTATLTSTTNPVTYCQGDANPVIAVSLNGNGPFTYDYTGGANGTGQSTGTIITSNTDNAATTYQLTKVTDANNCEGTSFGASVVVTQEEVPGVPTLRSDAETTVCEATVFNITATSVAVGTPTIIWEQGGTGTEASPSSVVGNTAGSVTIYQAKAKIGNCPSESSLPLVVTVKESATVSLTVNKTTACEDEKVVFTASSTHADPGVTYDWYLNIEVAGINTEIKTVTTINPTYEVKLTDSDVLYSVKIANNSSCVGAEVSSNLQAVAVTKLPKPTLNSLSESLCGTDGGFDLVARDENGVIYTSGIDWRDGNDDKLLETSGSYHVTKTGTYAVYVTKNGCRSKIHSGRTVAQVVVQELSLDFSPSETQDIEEDEEVVLEAIVGGGIGALEYAWTRTETGNVTGSSSSYVYPASKTENVSVVVTDTQTNCTVSSGVTEINVLKSFKVPNAFTPNGDGFNDTWNIEGLETYRNSVMNVYNRWGQLVYSNHGSYTEAWDGRRNGKDLPIGTYYYVITLNQDGKENVSGDVTIVR